MSEHVMVCGGGAVWSVVMARRRTTRKMRKHMIRHPMITDTYTSSRRKSLPTANLMFDVDGSS